MPLGSLKRLSANNSALRPEVGPPLWRVLAAEMLWEKLVAGAQGVHTCFALSVQQLLKEMLLQETHKAHLLLFPVLEA